MTFKDKLIQVAENTPEVYEAGYTAAINKFCPDFTVSGAAVSCAPIEGYPLKVVSTLPERDAGYTEISFKHGGKNIFDPEEYFNHALGDGRVTLDGDVFTCNFTNAAVYINNSQSNRLLTKHGTYTLRICPVSEDCRLTVYLYRGALSANRITYKNLSTDSGSLTMSFTVADDFSIAIGGTSGKEGTYSFRVQLEVGSVATDYEAFIQPTTALASAQFPFPGGTFDWDTGKLTTTSGAVQNLPIVPIVGRAGVNTFVTDTGTIEVSGKADPTTLINMTKEASADA